MSIFSSISLEYFSGLGGPNSPKAVGKTRRGERVSFNAIRSDSNIGRQNSRNADGEYARRPICVAVLPSFDKDKRQLGQPSIRVRVSKGVALRRPGISSDPGLPRGGAAG